MSQDWGYLLFKLSLTEALEEVATSITEEAWLNNEDAIYISFDYIHCFCLNLCSLIRSSKIIPSFFVDKASCTRQFKSELSLHSLASLFSIKEGIFLPLRLSCKESSTFLSKPLFPQGREDVTALRCSEPLRSKVGGPSKVSPDFAGWDRLVINHSLSSLLFFIKFSTLFLTNEVCFL